jgi:hypothetical protein
MRVILAILSVLALTLVLYGGYEVRQRFRTIDRTETNRHSGMIATRFGELKDATTAYEVKYTQETVVVSNQDVRTHLLKMSDDGATFDFDASSGQLRDLKVGSVMLLSGVALRKVTEVVQKGPGIQIRTGPAQLTDAIQNGKIEAKFDVNFGSFHSNPALTGKAHNPFAIVPVVYAETTETEILSGATDFTVTIQPFTYKVKFTPVPGQLNIDMRIDLVSAAQGFLSVTGKGFLKNFQSTAQMLVQDRAMSNFNFSNSGLSGEIEFSWAAGNAVAGPITRLASWPQETLKNLILKNAAFKIPFMVGPIPFNLKFSAGVTFIPGFTSKNGLCKGSLKVSFGGDGGFLVTHGQTSPSGAVSESGQLLPSSSILSLGPVGFTVAVEMPRIELALGLNPFTLIPAAYLNAVTSYGIVTNGVMGMPMPLVGAIPCQTHSLVFALNAGMSVGTSAFSNFLGVINPKASISTVLYQKKVKQPGATGVMCHE